METHETCIWSYPAREACNELCTQYPLQRYPSRPGNEKKHLGLVNENNIGLARLSQTPVVQYTQYMDRLKLVQYVKLEHVPWTGLRRSRREFPFLPLTCQ